MNIKYLKYPKKNEMKYSVMLQIIASQESFACDLDIDYPVCLWFTTKNWFTRVICNLDYTDRAAWFWFTTKNWFMRVICLWFELQWLAGCFWFTKNNTFTGVICLWFGLHWLCCIDSLWYYKYRKDKLSMLISLFIKIIYNNSIIKKKEWWFFFSTALSPLCWGVAYCLHILIQNTRTEAKHRNKANSTDSTKTAIVYSLMWAQSNIMFMVEHTSLVITVTHIPRNRKH